jgi:hydroxyethylthiazole kinase-like uncharacterized protein yjeF
VAGATARTPGALRLAAEAALRAGAGKLTIVAADVVAAALAVAVPESLVAPVSCTAGGDLQPREAADVVTEVARDADAVLVGPGCLDAELTVAFLTALIPRLRVPVVLDATASAYLTDQPHGLHHLKGRAVLTVNPSELALTARRDTDTVEQQAQTVAAEVAARSEVVVLCGGPTKNIAAPDGRGWVFEGGGPGLGVSGSGDVQAGIVAGLLARGADPDQAAVWAAYLHGRTGERLAAGVGVLGHLAREQPEEVPQALSELA